MKQLEFEKPERLPVIPFYETAFRKATGVSLKVIPPDEPKHRLNLGEGENAFCRLAAGTPSGCDACLQTQVRVQRVAGKNLATQQINCFAGLTDVAARVAPFSPAAVANAWECRNFQSKPFIPNGYHSYIKHSIVKMRGNE